MLFNSQITSRKALYCPGISDSSHQNDLFVDFYLTAQLFGIELGNDANETVLHSGISLNISDRYS